jgi:hypothetical protein
MCDLNPNDSIGSLILESWKPEARCNQGPIERARLRIGVMHDFTEENYDLPRRVRTVLRFVPGGSDPSPVR